MENNSGKSNYRIGAETAIGAAVVFEIAVPLCKWAWGKLTSKKKKK